MLRTYLEMAYVRTSNGELAWAKLTFLLFITVGLSEVSLKKLRGVPLLAAAVALEDMHLGTMHAEGLHGGEGHIANGANWFIGLGGMLEQASWYRVGPARRGIVFTRSLQGSSHRLLKHLLVSREEMLLRGNLILEGETAHGAVLLVANHIEGDVVLLVKMS